MVITKRHAEMLEKLHENSGEFSTEDWSDFNRETLWHLELSGLVRPVGLELYDLTFSGNILAEMLKDMEDEGIIDVKSWDESFRWIGSEIISMIRYLKPVRSDIRGIYSEELEKRGFSKDGRLNRYAHTLDEIYESLHPRLIVNSEMAESLRSMPEGPGKSKALSVNRDMLLRLESMRLIAFSVPRSDVYSLTGLGQQIKAALLKGLVVSDELVLDELVLDLVAKAYRGSGISEAERRDLMERGIMGFSGELLPSADHLYLAWKIYRKGPYTGTPSFQISKDEVKILKVVEKLWKMNEENPEIYPDHKHIEKELSSEWNMRDYSIKLALYNLEGFDLIRSEEYRSGGRRVLVYNLTSYGREILEDQSKKERDVSSKSVKAITMTKKEFAAPNLEWYETAREEGLVSENAPTKSGKLYARLSVEVERKPLITSPEMRVLRKIPYISGVFIEDLNLSDEEALALEKLESKNLVEILPTETVVLTKAGQMMKKALSGVPDGVGTPVTPIVIRLLQAIRKVGGTYVKENRIRIKPENWKAIENEVGVDPETFNDAMMIAKSAKYIGKDSITEAGKMLLEAVDELSKREYPWVEF